VPVDVLMISFELNGCDARQYSRTEYTRFSSNECCDVGLSEFELCPELSRAGPIEMPCAATLRWEMPISSFPAVSNLRETSVLWLPRSVPPLKTGRSQWRPACGKLASSLARLDPMVSGMVRQMLHEVRQT